MGLLTAVDKAAIRRGAWYKVANDPIPAHVKDYASTQNPFHGALVIATLSAAEAASYRNGQARIVGQL